MLITYTLFSLDSLIETEAWKSKLCSSQHPRRDLHALIALSCNLLHNFPLFTITHFQTFRADSSLLFFTFFSRLALVHFSSSSKNILFLFSLCVIFTSHTRNFSSIFHRFPSTTVHTATQLYHFRDNKQCSNDNRTSKKLMRLFFLGFFHST